LAIGITNDFSVVYYCEGGLWLYIFKMPEINQKFEMKYYSLMYSI